MIYVIGLVFAVVLYITLSVIRKMAPPTFAGELPVFAIIVLLAAGMIGWELYEYLVERVFDMTFYENSITRILQILHTLLAVIIAYRGYFIGVSIFFLVLLGWCVKQVALT